MALKPSIVLCHPDAALCAEVSFWAVSAEYDVVSLSDCKQITEACRDGKVAAIIIGLDNQGEEVLDTLEAIARTTRGKVIAICPQDGKTISSLRRLFEAKSLGIAVFARDEFSTHKLAGLLKAEYLPAQIDREILAASLKNRHVIAHYQPKVPFQPGGEKYGVEALCRIQHPELGLLYPDSFVPLAEAHGLILELTDAVTVHAFESLKVWDQGGTQLRLALNISPRLMADTAWFELFQKRCQEFSIDPGRITLEVTESSSQGGKVLALEILSRLRLQGFLLSIDDFGTGFSSLETLYKLPFGELKIDKGFILDLHRNAEARALVESTVMLARKLGLRICAEGVESEAIFQELRDLKCDDAQGYHVSQALPAEQIPTFFQNWAVKRRAMAPDNPASKFAAIHALVASLFSSSDDEDETVVLGADRATDQTLAKDYAPSGRELAGDIPALVMGGKHLAALDLVHRALAASRNDSDFTTKLTSLREELERSLGSPGPLSFSFAGQTLNLIGSTSVTLGRQSPTAKSDIAIACQWLSRGEKNLRLSRTEQGWQIEDLGSTNGHFIDGKRLANQTPFALPGGDTIVEIGRSGQGPAPAWLNFAVTRGAVHVRFGLHQEGESEFSWMVVADGFTLGGAEALVALPQGRQKIMAEISRRDGMFWIAPFDGRPMRIDGVDFAAAVPLPADIDLMLGDCPCSTRPAMPATSEPASATG